MCPYSLTEFGPESAMKSGRAVDDCGSLQVPNRSVQVFAVLELCLG